MTAEVLTPNPMTAVLADFAAVPDHQRRNLRAPTRGPLCGDFRQKAITSAAGITNVQPVPGVISPPMPQWTVRGLIPQGTTTGSGVSYVRELTYTNSGRVVGEGLAKPESSLTYEGKSAPVITVAHTTRVSDQLLSDAPAFAAQMSTRLLYGLSIAEDRQLLNGTGVLPETQGLMTVATATTGVAAPVAPSAIPAAVAKAIGELAAVGMIATGVIMNPADWIGTQTTVVGGGLPFMLPTLYGLPVVLSAAMAVGNFLVGWFGACQIFDREDAAVQTSTEDRDNFTRDLVTVRAEERFAFAIYIPAAFRKAG